MRVWTLPQDPVPPKSQKRTIAKENRKSKPYSNRDHNVEDQQWSFLTTVTAPLAQSQSPSSHSYNHPNPTPHSSSDATTSHCLSRTAQNSTYRSIGTWQRNNNPFPQWPRQRYHLPFRVNAILAAAVQICFRMITLAIMMWWNGSTPHPIMAYPCVQPCHWQPQDKNALFLIMIMMMHPLGTRQTWSCPWIMDLACLAPCPNPSIIIIIIIIIVTVDGRHWHNPHHHQSHHVSQWCHPKERASQRHPKRYGQPMLQCCLMVVSTAPGNNARKDIANPRQCWYYYYYYYYYWPY